jgi:hypothetical protein
MAIDRYLREAISIACAQATPLRTALSRVAG